MGGTCGRGGRIANLFIGRGWKLRTCPAEESDRWPASRWTDLETAAYILPQECLTRCWKSIAGDTNTRALCCPEDDENEDAVSGPGVAFPKEFLASAPRDLLPEFVGRH